MRRVNPGKQSGVPVVVPDAAFAVFWRVPGRSETDTTFAKSFLGQSQRLDRRLVDCSRDWQAVIALEVYEGRSGKMALERRREKCQK